MTLTKKESDHKYYVKNKGRLLKWKGKNIHINIEKKGICDWCGAKKGIDVKQTQFHHIEYDDNDPALHIVELCASCHRKETIRQLGSERVKEIARLGGLAISKEQLSKMGKISWAKRVEKEGLESIQLKRNIARKWVYNRWTGKLVKRRTFNFDK